MSMNQKNIYRNALGTGASAVNYPSAANRATSGIARAVLSLLLVGWFIHLPANAAGSDSVHFVSIGKHNNGSYDPANGNYNNDGAVGENSIAIGVLAHTGSPDATSVGTRARTMSFSATAVGHGAYAGTDSGLGRPPTAVGAGARAIYESSVALGESSLTEKPVATQRIEIAGTEYSFAGSAPQATVSIGRKKQPVDPNNPNIDILNETFTRTLINLGAGRISEESTDGINGSQLFATNQALESLSNEVTALQGASSTSGSSSSQSDMHFFSVRNPQNAPADITQAGNYNNDGAEADGAIAIGPYARAQGVESIAIGSRAVTLDHPPVGGSIGTGGHAVAIAGITWEQEAIAIGYGAIAKQQKSVALGSNSTTEEAVATEGIDIAGQHYDFAGTDPLATVSIGARNTERASEYRTLTNLAAGRVSSESTDGINGSQLFAFQQALEELGSQVNKGSSSSSGAAAGGSSGAWTLTDGSRPVTIGAGNKVTFAGDRNIAVTQTGNDGNGQINVALSRDLDLDSVTVGASSLRGDGLRIAGGPSLTSNGIDGGNRKMTNVAPGALNENSTDAVNGSQLFATNRRIDNVIAQGIRNGGLSLVQYSDSDTPTIPNGGAQTNDVTLVGGDSTRAVTVHNVAAGRNATDAVNLAQLNRMGNRLNDRIDKVDERASRGIASSMAGAGLPQAYLPGKSMVAAATANYRGEQALAIGASTISDNGKWIIKGTVNANREDAGVSLGLGYQW